MKQKFEALVKSLEKVRKEDKVKNTEAFMETQKKMHTVMDESDALSAELKNEDLGKEEKDRICKRLRELAEEMENLAKEQEHIIDRGIII
jgi:hypothetical protein